jgi:large subunit ribosomal protein L6
MSRIGRAPVPIPAGVKARQEATRIFIEGPKGRLSVALPSTISVALTEERIQVQRASDARQDRALHGLYRALIANMVHGVVRGFSKELEISGVGYRAQLQGKQLEVAVGFSHPVRVPIPEGITVEVPKPTTIVVKGYDKQLVGQFAANIRRVAPPEPYKGKGIRYAGEVIRRKAGKAATGAGAKTGG